tara:strand:+ start:3474 stop:3842 length:369 start_codon:yes stop_codon:yes gene_type:complete
MAHYAFLDENNIVTEVIVGNNEDQGVDWQVKYGNVKGQICKRTSYNTQANDHNTGGTPFRGNFAGIGYTYDETNDVFYGPKPYDSWVMDETKWIWKSPVDYPSDGKGYKWNEETTSWDLRDE